MKRLLLVMLLLVLDVLVDGFVMRRAYTEKPISILPMKGGQVCVESFDKFRGVLLEELQNLHRRMLLGQISQNVDVVCHAAYGDGVTFEILQDARHIRPNAWANIRREPWVSSFGGEDDVAGENMK